MHTVGRSQDLGRGHNATSAHMGVVHAQGNGEWGVTQARLLAAHDASSTLDCHQKAQTHQAQNQRSLLHLALGWSVVGIEMRSASGSNPCI